MDQIIGLDFGNANSFPVFISGIDKRTRRGGNVKWLVEAKDQNGVPSVFHIDNKGRKTYGSAAAQGRPAKNRRDMLKSKIGQTEQIAGHTIRYDEEIVHLIKHIVDSANDVLLKQTGKTTNLIAIAYPVDYRDGQANRLVELAESVILNNGKQLRVVGRIKEPEAAALSYLSECDLGQGERDETVMVYDLGAGTFDASVVTVHQKSDGLISNYEVLDNEGRSDCGGNKFTEAMLRVLESKYTENGVPLPENDAAKSRLQNDAEAMKIYLSDNDYQDFVVDEDEDVVAEITKGQLENTTSELVGKTIESARALYDRVPVKPTKIVLAGGQSQMPIIASRLAEEFPQIGRQNIFSHRPQQAIAEGAARFGTLQNAGKPTNDSKPPVVLRTGRMIGLGRVWVDSNDHSKGTMVSELVPRNTSIPYVSPVFSFSNTEPAKKHTITFYQAKVENPEVKESNSHRYKDFKEIVSLDIDFQTDQPGIFAFLVKVEFDKMGLMRFYVEDPEGRFNPVISRQINYTEV